MIADGLHHDSEFPVVNGIVNHSVWLRAAIFPPGGVLTDTEAVHMAINTRVFAGSCSIRAAARSTRIGLGGLHHLF